MELQAASPPARRLTWVVGVGLILSGIGALAAWGMTRPGTISYYVTPSEALGRPADGAALRLGGRVAAGTLRRDGATVAFTVTDGRAAVPVIYQGEVPDTLKEGTDVVAEGRLGADGTLHATRVLAKCSSRFVPAVERQARARTR